jgi:hypothetical protein
VIGQSLRASERPLRESGSGQEVRADGLGSVNPLPSKGGCGESTRICPRNLFTMLSAEYAGGGRSCESDHLEPIFTPNFYSIDPLFSFQPIIFHFPFVTPTKLPLFINNNKQHLGFVVKSKNRLFFVCL